MESKTLEDEILIPLQEECSKEYISHHKSIPNITIDELNPIQKYHLNKRFLTAQGFLADIVEYLDHVMNFTDTKDTLLFLLLASFILYTIQYFFVYFPLLLILKVLHNSTKREKYKERELDLKRSYCIIQRVMKDTCELVEFYDLFMKDYMNWGDRSKTILLITELVKLSITGVSFIFIPFNILLILILWVKILERSHFFFCLFGVVKEFNRNQAEKWLGPKFRYVLDPPLEGLFEKLRKEKNEFAKESFLPFEIISPRNEEETKESDSDGEKTPFLKKLFKRSTRKEKRNKKACNYSPSDDSLFAIKDTSRNYFEKELSDTPIKDVIRKKFDQFKKFTEDIFREKISDEDESIHDIREVVSEEENDITEELKFERAISRHIELQRKHPKKRLVQIKQKTAAIYKEVGEELDHDSSFEVGLKEDESNLSSLFNLNSQVIKATGSKSIGALEKPQGILFKIPKK